MSECFHLSVRVHTVGVYTGSLPLASTAHPNTTTCAVPNYTHIPFAHARARALTPKHLQAKQQPIVPNSHRAERHPNVHPIAPNFALKHPNIAPTTAPNIYKPSSSPSCRTARTRKIRTYARTQHAAAEQSTRNARDAMHVMKCNSRSNPTKAHPPCTLCTEACTCCPADIAPLCQSATSRYVHPSATKPVVSILYVRPTTTCRVHLTCPSSHQSYTAIARNFSLTSPRVSLSGSLSSIDPS